MIARIASLGLFLVTASCAAPASTRLPSCWKAESFKQGERVAGSVTLVLLGPPEELRTQLADSALVTPLSCENGSFLVENPTDFGLFEHARPGEKGGDGFIGTAVIATVAGTVNIDPSEARSTHGRTPYRLVLSSVSKLRPISRPAWWRPSNPQAE